MSLQRRSTVSGESALRVLQVVQRPQRRGAEVFAYQLNAELRRQGHDVRTAYLYSSEGEESPLPLCEGDQILGVRPGHPLEKIPGLQPRILRRLARQVHEFRPDVMQLNGGRSVKYASFLRLVGARPRVTIYRNIGHPDHWLRSLPTRVFYRRFAVPQVDGIVGVSRATLDAVREFHGVTKPSVYIPRGVDARELIPMKPRDVVRAETTTAVDAAVMVYVGRLAPEKRIDRLVRVLDRLSSRAVPTYLWLVGDGPLRAPLKQQVSDAGLDDRVRFLGVRPDVATYLSAADVLVLSSDTEGTPGVVLEAGMCAVPAVATKVGGVQECILEGETGLLADAEDEEGFTVAVSTLLDDRARRLEMGQRAKSWVEQNFALPLIAQRYVAFYRQVLAAAGGGGAPSH